MLVQRTHQIININTLLEVVEVVVVMVKEQVDLVVEEQVVVDHLHQQLMGYLELVAVVVE